MPLRGRDWGRCQLYHPGTSGSVYDENSARTTPRGATRAKLHGADAMESRQSTPKLRSVKQKRGTPSALRRLLWQSFREPAAEHSCPWKVESGLTLIKSAHCVDAFGDPNGSIDRGAVTYRTLNATAWADLHNNVYCIPTYVAA